MKIYFILLVLLPTIVYSQSTPAPEPRPYIEVVGTAEREVYPDRITLSVLLSEKTNDKDQPSIEKQDDRLKKVLAGMFIPYSHLVLQDASSEVVKQKWRSATVKHVKEYHLELNSASQVSTFLSKLEDVGIQETSVVKVEHSHIDSLRREVRVDAIKAAKEKAVYLTSAIGEQLDKPLLIREQEPELFNYRAQLSNTLRLAEDGDDNSSSEQNFRILKISFSYYIRYSLK